MRINSTDLRIEDSLRLAAGANTAIMTLLRGRDADNKGTTEGHPYASEETLEEGLQQEEDRILT